MNKESELPNMTDQERAREIRDKKLCGPSVCQFDAGCGCLDSIVSALSAVREEERKRITKIVADYAERMRVRTGTPQQFIYEPMPLGFAIKADAALEIASAIRSSTEGDRHEGK